MGKYPWDHDEEIDFSKPWNDIADQYMERSFNVTDKFIDYYFKSEMIKMAGYTGWALAAILLFVLVVTK